MSTETITSLDQLRLSDLGAPYLGSQGVATSHTVFNPCSMFSNCGLGSIPRALQNYGISQDLLAPEGASLDALWPNAEYGDYFHLNDENFWLFREALRFGNRSYMRPGFAGLVQNYHYHLWWHYPHVSLEDPTMVAYTPNHEYGKRDRQVRVKVGRYLQKFYGDVLSESQIREAANLCKKLEIGYADDADSMVEVYANGPHSCMAGGDDCYDGGLHPVRAYATGEFRLAYIHNGERYTARGFVHEPSKTWVRTYGDDGTVLADMLRAEGYTKTAGWSGKKLLWIEHPSDDDAPLLPYIDGNAQYVFRRGDTLRITDNEEDAQWIGDNTDGTASPTCQATEWCSHCEEHYHEDDMRSVGAEEETYVCVHCRANNYTEAIVFDYRGQRRWRYVPDDETVEVDGDYYWSDSDSLEAGNIGYCVITGDALRLDECNELHEDSIHYGYNAHSSFEWPVIHPDEGLVFLTVDDIDRTDLVLLRDGGFELYRKDYVLEDEELMQQWGDNPDMFMPLHMALATGLVRGNSRQTIWFPDGSHTATVNRPGIYNKLQNILWDLTGKYQHPHVPSGTTYHLGLEPEFNLTAFDETMLRAMREAHVRIEQLGDTVRLSESLCVSIAHRYQELVKAESASA